MGQLPTECVAHEDRCTAWETPCPENWQRWVEQFTRLHANRNRRYGPFLEQQVENVVVAPAAVLLSKRSVPHAEGMTEYSRAPVVKKTEMTEYTLEYNWGIGEKVDEYSILSSRNKKETTEYSRVISQSTNENPEMTWHCRVVKKKNHFASGRGVLFVHGVYLLGRARVGARAGSPPPRLQ